MRLALAQTNPTIGDMAGNAAQVGRAIERARGAGAELVVLPELCISGYPPKDLLLAEGFVDAAVRAADEVGLSKTAGLTAVIGAPAQHPGGRAIGNSLLVYRDNRRVGVYFKRLLPTYDVFDEDRYFEPGAAPMVIDVGGVRVGLSICEDLWKGEDAGFAAKYRDAADPVAELCAASVDAIVSPSASPFVLGKGEKHAAILKKHAKGRAVFVASVNQLGGNDDLIFDGHGAVYGPDGGLVAASPGFVEDVLVVEVGKGGRQTGSRAIADPMVAMPPEEQAYKALVLGTRDYLGKTGFKDALIGLSGGIDSAVTAVIATAALGSGHVTGVVMPSRYSSEHSKTDAYELARRLGVRHITVPIEGPFTGFGKTLDAAFVELARAKLGATMPDLTEENLQSRIRGTILMALSNRTGAMVLTTGNKSELAVGYSTLYGDMNGGLAVLSDVSKQLVYRLARWMNANAAACGVSGPPIPDGSITKAPSAELRPNQTDQDSLPPYEVLDEIIERYVEQKQSRERIVKETGFDAAVVAKTARMIDLAEYKRKQLATGLKVTTVAFGTGRRVPIAQGWRG